MYETASSAPALCSGVPERKEREKETRRKTFKGMLIIARRRPKFGEKCLSTDPRNLNEIV